MAFDFYRSAAIRKALVVGLGLVLKQIDELNVVAFAIGSFPSRRAPSRISAIHPVPHCRVGRLPAAMAARLTEVDIGGVKQPHSIKQKQVNRVLVALDAQCVILHRLCTAQKTASTLRAILGMSWLALGEIGQRQNVLGVNSRSVPPATKSLPVRIRGSSSQNWASALARWEVSRISRQRQRLGGLRPKRNRIKHIKR